MKGWLKAAWHDPVGSKVISTLIVAALGAVMLWAKSGFSSSLAVVWASTVAIWSWLSDPMTLPIGVVLLTLITFAAVGWWVFEQRRGAIQRIAKTLVASELARERAEAELTTYKEQLQATQVPKCTISRNGPARFRVNGPTLHGLPAEPRLESSTRPFSLRQVFWL